MICCTLDTTLQCLEYLLHTWHTSAGVHLWLHRKLNLQGIKFHFILSQTTLSDNSYEGPGEGSQPRIQSAIAFVAAGVTVKEHKQGWGGADVGRPHASCQATPDNTPLLQQGIGTRLAHCQPGSLLPVVRFISQLLPGGVHRAASFLWYSRIPDSLNENAYLA